MSYISSRCSFFALKEINSIIKNQYMNTVSTPAVFNGTGCQMSAGTWVERRFYLQSFRAPVRFSVLAMAPCPCSLSYWKWPPLFYCRPYALRISVSPQPPFWRQRAQSWQQQRIERKGGHRAQGEQVFMRKHGGAMGERWPGGRKVLAVCKGRITQMLDSQRLDASPMHCEKDPHCPNPETIKS